MKIGKSIRLASLVLLSVFLSGFAVAGYVLHTEELGSDGFSTGVYSVSTGSASDIGDRSLNLSSSVSGLDDLEEPIDVWFEIREEGSEEDWSIVDAGTISGSEDFDAVATGLEPDVEYEFRACTADYCGSEGFESTNLYTVSTDEAFESGNGVVLSGQVSGLRGFTDEIDDEVLLQFSYREGSGGSWSTVDSRTTTVDGGFAEEVFDIDVESGYEFRAESEDGILGGVVDVGVEHPYKLGSHSFELEDVFLEWSSSDDVDGFNVYSNATGDFEMEGVVDEARNEGESGFLNLENQDDYICYHVKAYNEDQEGNQAESDPSEEVCRQW